MLLKSSIANLKGLGPKSAEKFQKLGIYQIKDLLLYYPFRYEDFKSKSALELLDGEKAVLTGRVVTPPSVQYYGFKRNRLSFKLKQGELVISVSFFNQPYLLEKIVLDQEVAIFGRWDQKKAALTGMKLLMTLEDDLQPVYHVAQGISQPALIKAIRSAFDSGALAQLEENLPEPLIQKYRLLPRQAAVYAMHFPKHMEDYKQALRRIKFEEFFYFQMNLQVLKLANKAEGNGLAIPFHQQAVAKKIAALPFSLTRAQQRSLEEILADMTSGAHMNRLLQGDVGSGKTVIASLAMYAAQTAGFQSALMVPTEILAEQHYDSLCQLFPDLSIALLTSGMKVAEKRTALSAIADGSVDMIVGTHALIQDTVTYHKLGLVITDEQHRFGVNQRRLFREKGNNPDVLMMTATPIPRTLAITAYGEMDVSIIDELPAGRKPIITRWVKHQQLDSVLAWVKTELAKGAQAYVISPLIEESETLDLKNAVALEAELKDYFKASASIALMHGKMKADDKEMIMQRFKAKEIDVLVSTTVIEVGVNVPNATIMLIMNADRFGLSQLHQLRGRVGRGSKQSYAILVADPKTDSGKERMTIMTTTNDGFVLAEADLKLRGSGEIFGTRQSGLPEFKTADIVEDYHILEEARRVATEIVAAKNWQLDPRWAPILANLRVADQFD
ncbi:TPA: ATP-dependent DNA helicase RecG [Streptococcus equi subsp. zooepidemicus]|uniref:ATP-dependent DNA helicase RecG n=1 Tax=Streptococcus equi TaxID=1336 RepID=UPI000DFEF3FE|nr:ATP-dependent DNA helicase RecG [Streptococcus equi subsp. zooepidemicus]MCD3403703.1 ATP-dependent DNA helicase RecG [Streptococcus equi subsp. zooepidemicus]SUN53980.1 ATP-dependent DNA helicase [Streptococcus equi subsp. zooepidemicus]HEL0414035.1 ATP-dependent DNA helicase RecG [Streptococcus equi subsp. zooepidemicus]HEL0428114.1 ATP-dependent DNA helicase RecG [Streptococcus equi subsp. zooepidemicus]